MSSSSDLDSLIRLKDALESAQSNTSKMLSKLNTFDQRLEDLDTKLQPLQSTTSNYIKAKENISLTLIEVGKTYEYFKVTNEVKDIINGGLNDNNYEDYLISFSKIHNAKNFFTNNNDIKSAQTVLHTLEGLYKVDSIINSNSLFRIVYHVSIIIDSKQLRYFLMNLKHY